jgi:hypothetical protein
MNTEDANKLSIWERMQKIDRRILYVILLIVIAIPTIYQVDMPNVPLPMSIALWKTIEETPKDKIVLISSDWSNSTRGENKGQMAALISHMMKRHIRFAVMSFDITASQVAQSLVDELAKKYGAVYGVDYIYFGYQPAGALYVKGINEDIITGKVDARDKKPLASWPVMKGIKSASEIHIVIEIAASAMHGVWLGLLKPGVKVGICPTAIMAPEAIPYFQSGQLAGILWGAKGAYDYEQLNVKNHTGDPGTAGRYMSPLSAAFKLIILSIVVGNVGMLVGNKNARRRSGE